MDLKPARRTSLFLLLSASLPAASQAQTLTTLTSFNGTNGIGPSAGVVQGADGNFYGTTSGGGASNGGTIFKITPGGTLGTLYNFCSQANCGDGSSPAAGLIQASDGNFYGTTSSGGANNYGTVFKIAPAGILTTLYSFCSQAGCADGARPVAGLIEASDGNFYGTTYQGGINGGAGTIFKITPDGTLTILYSFDYAGITGYYPSAALIQAADGNFYGTTSYGNYVTDTYGAVFKITPSGALTTLYSFCLQTGCAAGGEPVAGLIQGSDGNFYGTTSIGGANQGGTAFRISAGGTLTTLYSFCLNGCSVGWGPSGLIQAADGNLYGTTAGGGAYGGGTVFQIASGAALTTLYSFCAQAGCTDGQQPLGGLLQGADGNFYGTTSNGGANGDGTVFQLALTPSQTPPAINQSGGVVSGASLQAGIAAGSWISIFGTNLSSKTDTWANAISNGNLPTSLDNVKVNVGEDPAYIAYVSPTQINALAPSLSAGPAPVTVANASGVSASISAVVETAQPAFFQWGNYAVATRQDFSLAVKNGTFPGVTTTPAKPGDIIILWGTGFGPTSPSAPVGIEVPSFATYNTANAVTVTVGGTAATVYGAALAPGYAGLYQVAIQIPGSLANGDYPVVATVLGTQSPLNTLLTVQQ